MTLKEFEDRLQSEVYQFLRLWHQVGVGQLVEITEPKRGPAFAEKLILCLDLDSARKQIALDPRGAEGFVELAQNLVEPEKNRPLLAANMPRANLTPFYLLCSVVIDAARENPEIFQKDDKEDLDEPPTP